MKIILTDKELSNQALHGTWSLEESKGKHYWRRVEPKPVVRSRLFESQNAAIKVMVIAQSPHAGAFK